MLCEVHDPRPGRPHCFCHQLRPENGNGEECPKKEPRDEPGSRENGWIHLSLDTQSCHESASLSEVNTTPKVCLLNIRHNWTQHLPSLYYYILNWRMNSAEIWESYPSQITALDQKRKKKKKEKRKKEKKKKRYSYTVSWGCINLFHSSSLLFFNFLSFMLLLALCSSLKYLKVFVCT